MRKLSGIGSRWPVGLAAVVMAAGAVWPTLSGAQSRAPAAAGAVRAVAVADSLHIADATLARSVTLWRDGRLHAAAALLAQLDLTPESPWPRADRAAFLLAVLERQIGRPQTLRDKVAAAADAASASPYRRWLAYLSRWDAATGMAASPSPGAATDGTGLALPGAAILEAARLLDAGDGGAAAATLERHVPHESLTVVHGELLALALTAAGRDPEPAWRQLATVDARTQVDAEQVAQAQLRLARARLQRGEEIESSLREIAGSPATETARGEANRLLALTALARGDTAAATHRLDEALATALGGPARRQVHLERGALAAARGDRETAVAQYEAAAADWLREESLLVALGNDPRGAVRDSAWAVWGERGAGIDELPLSPRAVDRALTALAEAALDLRVQPDADPAARLSEALSTAATADSGTTAASKVDHGPLGPEFEEWRRQRDTLAQAAARRDELEWSVIDRRAERDRRAGYLEQGGRLAGAEADTLGAQAARLTAAGPRLDAVLASLRRLQEQTVANIARRTRALDEELRRNALYAQAVRHFHAEGPVDPRRPAAPAGLPTPSELLTTEIALSVQMAALGGELATRAPALIELSRREIWEPSLIDGAARLHGTLDAQRLRTTTVAAQIDTRRDEALADAELARRERDRDEAVALVAARDDSLRAARDGIAREVAMRGRARLSLEREGIDYHLADIAYWQAVTLATDPATADQPATVGPARELALARLDAFLARYPQSEVLSETRFRRADLELFRAQEDFRARMAGYLDGQDSDSRAARALAPHFEGDGAIAIYEAILRDDPAFAHRDAVLFNLGMLMADSGRPGAMAILAQLVEEHPGAEGAQEAWLRLGDERFDDGDYAGCLDRYEHAASGSDPALGAIALYRLGWARFATDAFAEAALAFGRLLDLPREDAGAPETHRRGGGAAAADLHAEAEDHLVQSLLRAGGADAFARHVEHAGPRPWDQRVLTALAALATRYSLHDDAVACHELWLQRYPEGPGALDASEHLVAALEAGRRTEAARQARLAQAPRFLPGSTWLATNDSTSLQERADLFARRAYEGAAVHEHQTARAGRDSTAWARALGHYETHLGWWPESAEAPRLHYQAGETARQLHDHARALRHFEAAARSDTATFAVDAAWQALAVRDAWYRQTQGPSGGVGADSLATALLAAGDEFRRRQPADERSRDLAWRQGQLAYAHGWDEDASRRLLDFSRTHEQDKRAAEAARLAGDAQYRRRDFAAAGEAYDRALALATATDQRALAAEMREVLPLCAFEHATALTADDSTSVRAASLYLDLAARWPASRQASNALYRAGLGFAAAGDTTGAVTAWERLLAVDARGGFGRDAAVRIAQCEEAAGRHLQAAVAWARLADLATDSQDAASALLRAIDLREAAADTAGAETLRDGYLKRFPDDIDMTFAIAESRARRELARARSENASVTELIRPAGKRKSSSPAGAMRLYLDLAEAHPGQASPSLLAAVDYRVAEESLDEYLALRLTQPLPTSLERKNRGLEAVVALLNRCVDRGDPEYAHAAAYRIGEAVIHLGTALLASERPAGLAGDDLAAYEDVLREQSWTFTERGEDAWASLLRKADRGTDPGGWLARTADELWPRLARRYLHRTELEYPQAPVAATAAASAR